MRVTVLIATIALMFAGVVPGFAQDKGKGPEVELQLGVKVLMRDGILLDATVYRSHAQKDRAPCIFLLTPYMAGNYHEWAMYFAGNGYVFATIDSRGRGNSDGQFTPFLQEANDGYDVVKWLAKQPYCNGKVSMWGASYTGYDQWATAKELPPALATIVPVASVKPGTDFPMVNNIFATYAVNWLTYVSGRIGQRPLLGDSDFWTTHYRRWYTSQAPFNTLDQVVGNPSTTFQTWLSHPMLDEYWDSFSPTPEQYAKIEFPILSITGYFDGDQRGALDFYKAHMLHGTATARAKHFLVIGPWDHGGTVLPKAELGGLDFGKAAVLDMKALHKAWYDWTLKNGHKPQFLKDRVAFYMVGEDTWRYAPSLEAATASTEAWYLASTDAKVQSVFASGDLVTQPPHRGGKPDSYVHDPLDTASLAVDDLPEAGGSLIDQRDVLLDNLPQLVYHSAPLTHDLDIAGSFGLTAYMELDQVDTDFAVSIYEIKVDGTSIYLAGDQKRARYRKSLRKAEAVVPGKIELYNFDTFNFTARRLAKGSRLRVVISPINWMSLEKNYNTGGVVSAESGANAKTVRVKLYHDSRHRSALTIPIAAKSSVSTEGAK